MRRLIANSHPSRAAARLLGNAKSTIVRCRVTLGSIFAIIYLFLARPDSPSLLAACALLVLTGCAIRTWASGYLRKGERLAVGGPYAYVRNPLYAGSFILALGFCLVLWENPFPLLTAAIWVIFVIAFGVVYPMKAKSEAAELRIQFGQTYEAYRAMVPAFLPLKGRVATEPAQRFSWDVFQQNREYQCLFGSAGVLTLLLLRYLAEV